MAYNHLRVTKGRDGRFESFAHQAMQEHYRRLIERNCILATDPQKILDNITEMPGVDFRPAYDMIPDRIMDNGLWAWGWNACYEALWKNRNTPPAELAAIFEQAVAAMEKELAADRARFGIDQAAE